MKSQKAITIYWTKGELIQIHNDIVELRHLKGKTNLTQETILEKCNKGIEAIQLYERADEKMHELGSIVAEQNEKEPMV